MEFTPKNLYLFVYFFLILQLVRVHQLAGKPDSKTKEEHGTDHWVCDEHRPGVRLLRHEKEAKRRKNRETERRIRRRPFGKRGGGGL